MRLTIVSAVFALGALFALASCRIGVVEQESGFTSATEGAFRLTGWTHNSRTDSLSLTFLGRSRTALGDSVVARVQTECGDTLEWSWGTDSGRVNREIDLAPGRNTVEIQVLRADGRIEDHAWFQILNTLSINSMSLAGQRHCAIIDDRTVIIRGSAAGRTGDSAEILVTNSMGETNSITSVSTGGSISQAVEVAGGTNRVSVQVFDNGVLVDRTLFDLRRGSASRVPLRIRLSWDTDSNDVDLHVYTPQNQHVYYAARSAGGAAGTLDIDDVNGYGPETVAATSPQSGVYVVKVVYFSTRGQTRPVNWHIYYSRNGGAWSDLGRGTYQPSDANSSRQDSVGVVVWP